MCFEGEREGCFERVWGHWLAGNLRMTGGLNGLEKRCFNTMLRTVKEKLIANDVTWLRTHHEITTHID